LDPNTTDLATSLGKLRGRLEPLLGRNGIDLSWDVDDMVDASEFPPEATLHILRIIQEAVTNILRHADADRVDISISASDPDEDRCLRVRVGDNGRGMSTPLTTTGRGISNMNSRAEELGAELRIEGTSSGTRIELRVPIPR
jgi:signal transduction histidine kinase